MIVNQQVREKSFYQPGGELSINSFFLTIQGEGPFVGFPAVFVRLRGCNLQCPQCDTEYTSGSPMTVEQIVTEIEALTDKKYLVVITGGEPFRQNIAPLTVRLLNLGYPVQIETNGTLYTPGPWDRVTIVCSPKTPKLNKNLVPYISAYKYVGSDHELDPTDGLPQTVLGNWNNGDVVARPHNQNIPVYIQPTDSKNEYRNKLNRMAVIDSCLKFGHIFCLQVHKILEME